MKQVLTTLPAQFQRVHKSYLVNIDKVSSYDQDNVEIMGKLLPLGRAYKDKLLMS